MTQLPQNARLENLSMLPTCGTKFYKYDGGWHKQYAEDFTTEERVRIIEGMEKAIASPASSQSRPGASSSRTAAARSRSRPWARKRRSP